METTSEKTEFLLIKNDFYNQEIVQLAREAHKESRFGYIEFSDAKVLKLIEQVLADASRHGLMLARRADEPIGFAYCSAGEYHIGTGVLITTIHNINVRHSVRSSLQGGKIALSLLRGVESWSQARGVAEVLLHVTSGLQMDATHRLAKRRGFQFIGGNYSLALGNQE